MIESDDDIFNHIKSVMRDHEEPYDEGAWERFKAVSTPVPVKKGAVSMWKWAMAAAAVVTAVLFLARIFNSSTPTPDPSESTEHLAAIPADSSANITRIEPASQPGESAILADEAKKEINTIYNNNRENNIHKYNNNQLTAAYKPGMRSVTTDLRPTVIQSSSRITPPQPLVIVPQAPVTAIHQPAQKRVDFWKNQVEVTDAPKTTNTPVYRDEEKQLAVTKPLLTDKPRKEKNKKWQPSLYVSPLFGDLGIDMGYGVSVGYAINDKIRISSGVAHTRLSASRSYGAGPVGEMIASAPNSVGGPQGAVGATGAAGANGATGAKGTSLDSKAALTSAYNFVAGSQTNSLQQVDGSLSGIDIPVEINYNFNKKLYASAGVSGLVVINDNKKYTYVDNRNVKVSVETNRGNLKEDKSVMFSEQNTTKQPIQAPQENIPFLGFYNISFGYRQKISGRTGVALEPFLKVPMKNVTQENLKYMGTGIRLKFDL